MAETLHRPENNQQLPQKKIRRRWQPAPLQIGESTRRINVAILNSNSKTGDYSYFSNKLIGDPDGV
jgi:hypothetical protein